MNSEFKGNGLYILYMPQRDTNMSDKEKKGLNSLRLYVSEDLRRATVGVVRMILSC